MTKIPGCRLTCYRTLGFTDLPRKPSIISGGSGASKSSAIRTRFLSRASGREVTGTKRAMGTPRLDNNLFANSDASQELRKALPCCSYAYEGHCTPLFLQNRPAHAVKLVSAAPTALTPRDLNPDMPFGQKRVDELRLQRFSPGFPGGKRGSGRLGREGIRGGWIRGDRPQFWRRSRGRGRRLLFST